jgi:hypothetical protein
MQPTTHLILKLVVTLSTILAACIGVIRAQPYADDELSAFLRSGDCAAPCFMGIRPGETDTQEAVFLLEHHAWVDKVTQHIWFSGPASSLYSWSWSGQQPALIDASAPGVFSTQGNIIDVLQVPTTIALGDFWLHDRPQQGMIADEPGELSYTAIYMDGTLEVQTVLFCPLRLTTFWQAPSQMLWSMYARPAPRQFELPDWFDRLRCP